MSWNVSVEVKPGEDATDVIDAAFEANPGARENGAEQLDAAKAAALQALRDVGRPGDGAYISLSGHANPDHAPRDGWADEEIRVVVQQRPVEKAKPSS